MIGKLQTNKVKYSVSLFDYIHSLDNVKLAEKISSEQKEDIFLSTAMAMAVSATPVGVCLHK